MDLLRTIQADQPHRVHFTRGVFDPARPLLAELLRPQDAGAPGRVLVVADQGFVAARPSLQREVEAYFAAHPGLPPLAGFRAVPGGETCKNDLSHLEWLLAEMNRLKLCRRSAVVAIGGGALLDLAGFAAAVCHRGIPLLRLPTTTLAQGDSGVGVKNAVNMFGKKNFIGAFAVPKAVVNDLDFLASQPDADFRAGFSECVKVALLKDAAFFAWLEAHAGDLAAREPQAVAHALTTSARLHLDHIALGGDPFETRSARPLDFGHWAAHKLEQMSAYAVPHGEAVAIGLALDCTWAALAGHCDEALAARVRAVLAALGLPRYHPLLADLGALRAGLDEFREHLGGRLTITLAAEPGRALDVHEVPEAPLAQAVRRLAEGAAPLPARA